MILLRYKKLAVISIFLVSNSSCSNKYEYDYYKIKECNLTLTVIRFNESGERFAAFINGKYEGGTLPTNNFILKKQISGLGAGFGFVPTCRGDTIIINHGYGVFKEAYKSKDIKSVAHPYEEFTKMSSEHNYIVIE
jgi:hypothetical protein